MIQVLADDRVVFDNRLEGYGLTALSHTDALNKSGMAIFTMPPTHPAYNDFVSYKTVVAIYKDDTLVFRGRAIIPSDDFIRNRTITCEGERGFLQDGVMRPYLFQDSPENIFKSVISTYNSQVDAFKQFKIGTVTVTDANDYIRLESTQAEKVSVTVDKLVERCGGYIVFTTDANGDRVINWYAELGYRSNQSIIFGENLTDYTRGEQNTDLATVIIPYGAQNQETGERLTIESVNDGLDYIQDDEAVALRGFIATPVYWDDVTQPANLLKKAQEYLSKSRGVITSLNLRAVDLALLDKSINAFQVGDLIRVTSRPHGIDEDFLLTERTEDLLNPANSQITMGKQKATLTGLDAAGDRNNSNALGRTEQVIRADFTLNMARAVQEAKELLTSLIEQTSEAIRLEVSEQYTTNGEIDSLVKSSMTQLADSFNFSFTELEKVISGNDEATREQFKTIEKYIRFVNGDIVLGEEGKSDIITLRISNNKILFLDGGKEVAYFSNKKLHVTDVSITTSLQIGPFKVVPRANGNTSIIRERGVG